MTRAPPAIVMPISSARCSAYVSTPAGASRRAREADLLERALGVLARVAQRVDVAPETVPVAERPQHAAAHVLEHRQPRKDVGDLEAARQAAPVDRERRRAGDFLAVRAGSSPAWARSGR